MINKNQIFHKSTILTMALVVVSALVTIRESAAYRSYAPGNASLFSQVTGITEWPINANEVSLLDHNDTVPIPGERSFEAKSATKPLYNPNPYRAFDHDPVIVGLTLNSNAKHLSSPIFWNDSGPWTTNFQVQNLDPNSASITITYVKPNGSIDTQINDTIPPNFVKTYDNSTTPDKFPSKEFIGSVMIQANAANIVAIANHHNSTLEDNALVSFHRAGSETVNLPLVLKYSGTYETSFAVQNIGTETTEVTVSYSTLPDCVEEASIAPGAAATFNQATNPCIPDGYLNSATVTSSAGNPIAVTVVESTTDSVLAYNGSRQSDSAKKLYMPVVRRSSNTYTYTDIQNTSFLTATVTVNYFPVAVGQPCSESNEVPAGATATFEGALGNCTSQQDFSGSAVIEANKDLAVTVEVFDDDQGGASYNAFNSDGATNQLVMPLIMDRWNGHSTGIYIQNVGDGPTTISCHFSSSPVQILQTLQAGDILFDNQLGKIGENFIGSANCSSTDQPIIALVDQKGSYALYEAINLAAVGEVCEGDFEPDGDVDGDDLSHLVNNSSLLPLSDFSLNYGKTGCI